MNFNTALRGHCLKRGLTLNEKSLKPAKEGVAKPPVLHDEAEVFAFLGLKYVPPSQRKDGACLEEVGFDGEEAPDFGSASFEVDKPKRKKQKVEKSEEKPKAKAQKK